MINNFKLTDMLKNIGKFVQIIKKLFWLVIILLFLNCAAFQPKPIFTVGQEKEAIPPVDSTTTTAEVNVKDRTDTYHLDREKIMAEIENLLGVPYRLGGMSPRGMDCSGFVNYVYENTVKMTLPRRVSELAQTGKLISRKNLQFGDLVFFKNIEKPEISHIGIYLDAERFAHASLSRGVIISNLNESYYTKRYAEARRIVE